MILTFVGITKKWLDMKDMYSIYLKMWHEDYRLKLCTVNMSHITRQSIICNVFIIFMISPFDGSASPLVKRSP
jgi:hypothetical protein